MWVIHSGTYKYKIDRRVGSLDIVEVGGEFITDATSPEYDWAGSFQQCGYQIVAESESMTTPDDCTVIIGQVAIHEKLKSFSLTDDPHSDEGHYNFVVNKYTTDTGKIGIVFSGLQNECDYAITT